MGASGSLIHTGNDELRLCSTKCRAVVVVVCAVEQREREDVCSRALVKSTC